MSDRAQDLDEMPRTGRWLVLAGFVTATLLMGFLAGLVTAPKIPTWYATIEKPWFNPPSWVFAPVWTVLYVVIAWSGWRIWQLPDSPDRRTALALYTAQLALNLAWSPAFFAAESPLLGMIVILPLCLTVFLTIRAFQHLDPPAGIALYPYLAWVSFATVLNAAILAIN